MNLSINLTLGSPVTDNTSSSAGAAEDMSDQGFGLRLADELNERELTPLMLPDDKKADDPAVSQQIAARQQIAADAETLADKDGRVWLEDPLAGQPEAGATDDESLETFAGDKPWLDIIEKAHSYSPVLQANKTSSRSVAEMAVADSTAAVVDPKQDLTLADVAMGAAEQASETDSLRPQGVVLTDIAKPETKIETKTESKTEPKTESKSAAKTESRTAVSTSLLTETSKAAAGSASVLPPSQSAGVADAGVAAVQGIATEAKSADVSADVQLQQPVANQPATQITTESVTVTAPSTPATGPSVQTDPTITTRVISDAGVTAPQSAARAPANDQPAVVVTDIPAEQPEIAGAAVIQKTAADRSDKQPVKTVVESALSAAEQTAMQQETERLTAGQQAVAMTAMQAGTVTANRQGGSQTTGTEKAPAANAFAVHLRAVNQTQQQQQPQSGAEQQPGQSQAKANVEVMPLNLSGPVVTAAPAFAQQLQQITETTPVAASVGQAVAQSAAITTGNTTLLSARPAETPGWQPPLALTEPAAAQQIKDRVMVQIQHKLQTAEVQLHPEELGSMQIKLNLQQDQLSVQFVVQQGGAKEALEQQMPKLRELLEQQGIALSEGQVEQRQSGSQQEQHTHRQGSNTGSESELAAVKTVQMKVSDRMVDFYA